MSFDLILPFLKPIEHLLLSETVSEIMVNSDSSVWMEEDGRKRLLPDVRFELGALDAGLEVIANRFGKRLGADSPILNLRLPDGSRLAAIIPPVVNPHPLVTIRKFTSRNFGINDLTIRGMLTSDMAATLKNRIGRGDNILIAGAGKTTALSVIREGAEAEGYRVEGFAPTSRAAQKLAEAGMETSTLQKHLARGEQPNTGEKRLYVLDESSMASTRQVYEFMNRLHPNDRVLLVGGRRQHEAVEAGRPFAQLQDAGMKTVRLDEIVRQKDPELKSVVEQLARGDVREAIQNLDRQGRVHQIPNHDDRIAAIAREYAKSPGTTLVVSPDNSSRMEINERIHADLQSRGIVSGEDHRIRTFVPRQDLTGADRTWAERYEVGDVLRYSRASKETGIGKGEYAQVKGIDAPVNRLTVELQDGTERTYDPRRQQGVSVFREELRNFSEGDRVQFTAPANDLKVANRELGTIGSIDGDGRLNLKLDNGRAIELDPNRHMHLDYGYAVTSHSSQGQTADRVLINVDTELGAKDLLNSRMAYVAVSRGAHDAQIFTNNAAALSQELSRDVSHAPAIQQAPISHAIEQSIEQQPAHEREIGQGFGLGM
jgi:ATP-dependent exoDNAse (exonuclease V) alpha subunit